MRKVVVLADALEDIEKARDFYDRQSPGLGDYFADSLLSDIESLALYHGIHRHCFGFYRMLAHRFPFGIYYLDTKTDTRIFGILDLRHDPNWIRKELSWRG
jgi:hypothetical protein